MSLLFVNDSDGYLTGFFSTSVVLLMVSNCLYFFQGRIFSYCIVLFVVFQYLYLFWSYTGLLFEFTGSDSSMYFRESQRRLNLTLYDALRSFVDNTKYGWDDAGMIAYSHIVFSIYNSIFFQRVLNFILLIFQATLLRSIMKRLVISKNIINLTLGIFITNSFILYFVSSGLKETIFTTIIVIIWYLYFLKFKSVIRNILLIVSTSSLYVFRIPEFLLTLIALSIKHSKKYALLLFLPLLSVLTFILYSYKDVIIWYLNRGDQDVAVAVNNGLIYKFSVFCSGLFGPFATFISTESQRDTLLYSMGLTTLMVIRLYSLLSLKYFFTRSKEIMPLLIHIGLHVLVLIVVDRTLKIRYWMPVIPGIFISFAYLLNLTERRGLVSVRMLTAMMLTFIWLFFWNILRYN